MVTRKDRRHSGYVTPAPTVSKKDLIKYGLFINPFYDDWDNYRDGFRDFISDSKKIKKVQRARGKYLCEEVLKKRIRMNLKQKKLLKRRQAKKYMGLEKLLLSLCTGISRKTSDLGDFSFVG